MRMIKSEFKHSNFTNGVRFTAIAIAMQHNSRPIHGRGRRHILPRWRCQCHGRRDKPLFTIFHYQGVQLMQ